MSKKNTKNGGLKSIPGGKGGSGTTTKTTGANRALGNTRGGNGNGGGFGPTSGDHDTGDGKVVDFTSVRAQRSLDNRRTFERFFMQQMVDAYCEINGAREMLPIELVEISETGCSFRLTAEKAALLPRDTAGAHLPLHVRLYFSKDSYLRIGMFVANSTRDISTGKGQSIRFGCRVDETFASTDAYRQFARFMEQFASHAARDTKHASAY